MAKQDPPLKVEIPRPGAEQPAWSRVGIIGAAGFLIGVVWPKLAGVQIAPGVPEDLRAQPEVTAPASASAAAVVAPPAVAIAAAVAPAPATPANQELVVVGAGTISRCVDKKNKKVDECGSLQFDPIALPKLKELSKCPSALGLAGKLAIGFDIDFEKKEVHVVKAKKTSLPSSTVNGVLQCAAREFANIALEDVPHKFRRYTLFYTTTFYPPGKHPDTAANPEANQAGDNNDGEESAGKTTSETEATGTATVSWDTALVRKEPKDGEVVVRLLQGTKVKLLGRQNDWYKVEAGSKTGWIYRGAIGL